MSDKLDSMEQVEPADDSRIGKIVKTTGKNTLKHTNFQSIHNNLLPLGRAATSGYPTQSDGKHHHHHPHHHHHHSHGHHPIPHVIHKTTSESLRLGGEVNNAEGSLSLSNSTSMSGSSGTGTSSSGGNQPIIMNASVARKPKTSSFQITSVTVGNKMSADNGEDSADDLDESHTDDNSRITDMENETPSFSEDTFSKEDVFYSNSALGTAPVIPTSSQYGLVIVDPDMSGVGGQPGQNLSNVHVSMTDAGINIVGSPSGKLGDSDQKDMHHRNERFKVVKIESTEPFKRGRWMCMDYLDHSTLQGSENVSSSSNVSSTTQAGVTTNDSGVVIVENSTDVSCETMESNPLYNTSVSNNMSNAHSPGQSMQKPVSEQQTQSMNNNITTVPSGLISQTAAATMPNPVPPSISQQASMVCPSYTQPQMHPTLPVQQYAQTSHMPGQSQPAHFYQNSQQNPPTVSAMHGATLPSNMNIQNGVPTNFVPQVQQQQQQQQPQPQQVQPAPQSMSTINVGLNASASCPDPSATASIVTSMPGNNLVQATSISQPASMVQVIPQAQQQAECYIPQPQSQSYPASAIPVTNSASGMGMDIHHPDLNSVQSQQPAVVGGLAVAPNTNPQTISPAVETIIQQQQQQQQPQTNQSPLQNMNAISQDSGQPPMTIMNDGSSTVSTPQQAQASSAAGVSGQQSSVSNEEEQAGALEADGERVSTLALALTKHNRPSYKLYNFAVKPDDQQCASESTPHEETVNPHYYHSQNLINANRHEDKANANSANTMKSVACWPHADGGGILAAPRTPSLAITSTGSNSTTSSNSGSRGFVQLASSWSGSVDNDDSFQSSSRSLGTSPGMNNECSASGTSAVAIDNKIEQAMDLVKSHLMIAVREEVEVLKEKIAELMDRINQLELENTILKANVSQETLTQLSATMQSAAAKPPQNSNTSNGPIS